MDNHNILKFALGIIIVPLGIALGLIWPWWTKQSIPTMILTGFIILPLTAIMYPIVSWWEKF